MTLKPFTLASLRVSIDLKKLTCIEFYEEWVIPSRKQLCYGQVKTKDIRLVPLIHSLDATERLVRSLYAFMDVTSKWRDVKFFFFESKYNSFLWVLQKNKAWL